MCGFQSIRFRGFSSIIVLVDMVFFRIDAFADLKQTSNEFTSVTLTNVAQVRQAAMLQDHANHSVKLTGVVLWCSSTQHSLILEDDSGGAMVNVNLHAQPKVWPGDKVMLQGNCQIMRGGEISDALIDNDGIHSSNEVSGTIILSGGLHPMTVEWFNHYGDRGLTLDCSGPGILRGQVPDDLLFRKKEVLVHGTNDFTQGLNYSYYEGDWEQLPDFSQVPVLKHGVIPNLSLQVCRRATNAALVFSGYFKAPQDGNYTFWLESDDGSKLYFGSSLRLTVLGDNDLPTPRTLFKDRFPSEQLEMQWVRTEGVVTQIREANRGVIAELAFGTQRINLKVPNGNYESLKSLLHEDVKVTGIYQIAHEANGQPTPLLLIPGVEDIAVSAANAPDWARYSPIPVSLLARQNYPEGVGTLVRTFGTVGSVGAKRFVLRGEGGQQITVETEQSLPGVGAQVEVLGRRSGEKDGTVLHDGIYRAIALQANESGNKLPLLTKAIQVKSLSRDEARRRYPIKIRGVITARSDTDFVIQDSTWSVFCYFAGAGRQPQIGEYWEIEGVSGLGFAPDIVVKKTSYLGPGILPEPIRPTRDELINGSLDTQYIEVQGIPTAVETNTMTMLTREGRMQFEGFALDNPDKMRGALVRVRGVCVPNRAINQVFIRATLSPLRLFSPVVIVDRPAPVHPFEIPLRRPSDLLYFDARADALRRVKMAGQVMLERHGQYFAVDGDEGFRFKAGERTNVFPGDMVQVVGFPDVSGPSPVLNEAQVRVVGHADLPKPHRLSGTNAFSEKWDDNLIQVTSRLLNVNVDRGEILLELQMGVRNYMAQLPITNSAALNILPGSLVQLTGVYMAEGPSQSPSGHVDSFTVLLNAASDIRVLARPSWWTVRHTLIVIGGMIVVLVIAMIWITQLHRQVEVRTSQLASEIKLREQTESQRMLEVERTRIAQDLHDELGATLTEMRFLGAVKSRDSLVPETTRSQLKEISEKSHQMVSALDEIVWAVNPANDSLPHLANYLCHVTEEFFRASGMRCRLDINQALPLIILTSEVRHNLYLVVREALNNVVKHSRATEAWLRIQWVDQCLHISVEDNGCGFVPDDRNHSGNGLSNMPRRIQRIGGVFECETAPGRGTQCRIYLSYTSIIK